MIDLKTNYLGLELHNPLIVGSCGLTKNAEKMYECQKAGAGAVVVKSLFEEALALEQIKLSEALEDHPEAYDYKYANIEKMYGSEQYCEIIREAKRKLNIPVIASLNCISEKWWKNYAKQVEEAGADAIELNIYTTVYDEAVSASEVEYNYLRIAESVRKSVDIPVAIKISKYITAFPNLAFLLEKRGINGLVMFNKFVEPDIDISKMELRSVFNFSKPEDFLVTLRWIGILSGERNIDLCASTGIFDSEDAIKVLLAGGKSFQVVSAIYNNGFSHIRQMLDGITEWMKKNNFSSIEDFRGKLSFKSSELNNQFLRAQFIEKTDI